MEGFVARDDVQDVFVDPKRGKQSFQAPRISNGSM